MRGRKYVLEVSDNGRKWNGEKRAGGGGGGCLQALTFSSLPSHS